MKIIKEGVTPEDMSKIIASLKAGKAQIELEKGNYLISVPAFVVDETTDPPSLVRRVADNKTDDYDRWLIDKVFTGRVLNQSMIDKQFACAAWDAADKRAKEAEELDLLFKEFNITQAPIKPGI